MNWLDNRSTPETLEILGRLSEVCGKLGGPISRELLKFVEGTDYLSLINYRFDYENIEVNDAIYARQIQGFFQKLEDLNLGIDKACVAADRFAQSELMCLETNRTLSYHRRKPFLRASHVDVVLHYAQRKIADILGTVPSLDELQPQFGPGANTNVNAALACPRAKLSADIVCSHEMMPTVPEFLYETPEWASLHALHDDEDRWVVPVTVAPGKLIFVPKNAKTDRSIVVEPILNSFFQKGVGSYIRNRLLHSGIDLRDQTVNQRYARLGSLSSSRHYATVDLSMASDCLSTELVYELLPYDWSELLGRLRTGNIELPNDKRIVDIISARLGPRCSPYEDGKNVKTIVQLEKFSSMGNGFTFELESLIFYSLVYGVQRSLHLPTSDISVYGDDLIVNTAAFSRLSEVLSYCGFQVNSEKSYSSGSFRESCGADYLNGFDIRPFYQKSLISDRTLYTMHNWFLRHGERELAATAESYCKSSPKLYGPDGYGDGHLIGSYHLRTNRKAQRDGWCGGFFDTYTLKPKRVKTPLPGDRVLPSYSVYTRSGERDTTDPDIVRGSCGYAKVSIYTLVESIFHD